MDIRHAVEVVGLAVDAVGVAVIVLAIGIAGVAFARGLNRGPPFEAAYRGLRQSIGRGILLGLELLVAGDIIRTVAIAPTFASVGVLAGRFKVLVPGPPSSASRDSQNDSQPALRGRF